MIKQLKETTKEFLSLNNFDKLKPVQKHSLSLLNKKNDLFFISKTGSGKTHAYLLPIMEIINTVSNKVQVVISLPTKELAEQVNDNIALMKKVLKDLRCLLLTAGKSIKPNLKPHIIIGTPGKIRSVFESTNISVNEVKMMVIDEADMTLEYGFLEDIDVVLSHMKKSPKVLCFSATCNKQMEVFVKKYLTNHKMITISNDDKAEIKHVLVNCKHRSYKEQLLRILPGINPYICMIFANSKTEVDEVYQYLSDNDYKCLVLHGGLDLNQRKKALYLLKSDDYKYVVCSDVMSRGIDIDGISHVISLGIPKDKQFYMHRAGRTGRNNRTGTCYTVYKEEELEVIKKLKKEGIDFVSYDFKNNQWVKVKNPTEKRQIKVSEDKEIAKILFRKKEKVKPNYKKKKNREIEKIKRKKKREFIKEKIKEERIKRYKQESIAKRENNN